MMNDISPYFFNSIIDKAWLHFSRTFLRISTKLAKSVQRVSAETVLSLNEFLSQQLLFITILIHSQVHPFSIWFSKIKKSTYWSAFQSYALGIFLSTIKYPSIVVAKIVCYDLNNNKFGELISNSPKTTVNNWERGINLPKEDKLKKIALLGKTTTNELLYGSPEEFITKIVVNHFRVQLNPLFIQQIILFLNQKKIKLYDEMTIIEFIQEIFDSDSFIEEESIYLSYSPVIGYDNLYTASDKKNKEIGAPIFYVYIEMERNRVHYLPFTFLKHQKEQLRTLPTLRSQIEIDYYTRQFPLLDVELKESMIFYYGIKENNTAIVARYEYDNQKKSYSINQKNDEIETYAPFKVELDKMLAFFDREH